MVTGAEPTSCAAETLDAATGAGDAVRPSMPGEAALWVLISGDLVAFSIMFGAFVFYRHQDPDGFVGAQAVLNHGLGILNTLLLLTGSLFVAIAVRSVRAESPVSRRWFSAGMACGAAFVAVKVLEYGLAFHHGATVNSGMFFTMYFTMTGIHLVHVVAATLVLGFVRREPLATRTTGGSARTAVAESGAVFWHMVDLLWMVLFALLYLAS